MSTTNVTPKMRRFQFIQGASCKFWQVGSWENIVLIRFGRIGTSGQQIRKPFSDAIAAQKHAEHLIGQKLGKGYVEVAV